MLTHIIKNYRENGRYAPCLMTVRDKAGNVLARFVVNRQKLAIFYDGDGLVPEWSFRFAETADGRRLAAEFCGRKPDEVIVNVSRKKSYVLPSLCASGSNRAIVHDRDYSKYDTAPLTCTIGELLV